VLIVDFSFHCRLGAELGFEDPNLTAKVSENLEKMMVKRRQIPCA
jgi:lysine-specific demethylase 3